tara:strand:+ start:3593 stop:4030 length:438 start_codon:yes stop_codon:yes gene_type:complete
MINLTILKMILYFLIGALSGISMGVIGVGAGMLTIPLLLYSGLTLHESVGISLIMQLLPQSLPGVILYYKEGSITITTATIAMFVVIGSLIGIYFGSYLVHNNYINLKFMYGSLASLLIGSGLYIIYIYLLNDEKIIEEKLKKSY